MRELHYAFKIRMQSHTGCWLCEMRKLGSQFASIEMSISNRLFTLVCVRWYLRCSTQVYYVLKRETSAGISLHFVCVRFGVAFLSLRESPSKSSV